MTTEDAGMMAGHGLSSRRPAMQIALQPEVLQMLCELMKRSDPTALFTGPVQEQFRRYLSEYEGRARAPVPQAPPVLGHALPKAEEKEQPK